MIEKPKRGNPYTPEQRQKFRDDLAALVAKGMPLTEGCRKLGVEPTNYFHWVQKGFIERIIKPRKGAAQAEAALPAVLRDPKPRSKAVAMGAAPTQTKRPYHKSQPELIQVQLNGADDASRGGKLVVMAGATESVLAALASLERLYR